MNWKHEKPSESFRQNTLDSVAQEMKRLSAINKKPARSLRDLWQSGGFFYALVTTSCMAWLAFHFHSQSLVHIEHSPLISADEFVLDPTANWILDYDVDSIEMIEHLEELEEWTL